MREAWKEAEGRRGSNSFGIRVGDIYDEGKGRTRTEESVYLQNLQSSFQASFSKAGQDFTK